MLDRDKKKRLGQNGDVDEVLAHPFFKDLDLVRLLNYSLKPSFIPKVPDLEQIKANANVVSFKDLHETEIPNPKKDMINEKMEDFDIFGDFTKNVQKPKEQEKK